MENKIDFYYQIKGKASDPQPNLWGGTSVWEFPPIFCGKVSAVNRESAKKEVEAIYGRSFPTRVLKKDLDNHHFLLNIEEIKPGSRIEELFEQKKCTFCGSPFYVIDKYNALKHIGNSFEFCSEKCKNNSYAEYQLRNSEYGGRHAPVIYKITNKVTGKCYIGKTTQAFTLRWYQHFYQSGSCKFHDAVRKSSITDWTFEVQEIVEISDEKLSQSEIEKIILQREMFWINQYNSIEDGYNTMNNKNCTAGEINGDGPLP